MAASFKTTHEQPHFVRLYSKDNFSAISELLLEAHIEVGDAIHKKEKHRHSSLSLCLHLKKEIAKNQYGSITQP